MKTRKGVRRGTGPEGERGGKNEGKRVGGRGARKHTRKTLILVHLRCRCSLKTLQSPFKTSATQKRDRGRDSQPVPRLQLNFQPQGDTKIKLA